MSAAVDVYVDVDGVLNAVTGSTPAWGWERVVRSRLLGYTITWSPDMVERLNALADLPHVEFHWLTTWCEHAPRELVPEIGLNGSDWSVLGIDEHRRDHKTSGWWKLAALRDYHASRQRQGIWLDDDIKFDREARLWVAETPTVTAFSPDTGVGLTTRDLDAIEAIAAGEQVTA